MKKIHEAVARLREAVEAERLSSIHTADFSTLLEKMALFYEGRGPAPEMEDFAAWRASVESRKMARESDFGDLSP